MQSLLVSLCILFSNTVRSKKYGQANSNTRGFDGEYGVIIMGAGMSGVSAATELCANGMDPNDILIIDGADYIGGRTNVGEFGGYSLNVGASWLMGSCAFCNESFKEEFELNPMFEIAEEIGLLFVEENWESEKYFDPLQGDPIDYEALDDAYDAYYKAYDCVQAQYWSTIGNPSYDPWKADDSMGLALANCNWTSDTMYQNFVEWYEWDFETAVEPEQCSAFSTIDVLQNTYGPNDLYITDPRGYHGIVMELANGLIDKGVTIELNHMITYVSYGDDHVTVRTENGKTYTGKYGINTFSVGVLQSETVEFSPSLPTWKQEVIDKHLMADYAVMYIQWPYDWWSVISNNSEQLLFIQEEKGYFPWAKDLNHWKYFEGSLITRVDIENDLAQRIQSQSKDDTIDEYLAKLALFVDDVPEPLDVMITNWTNYKFSLGAFPEWAAGFTLDDWDLMQDPVCNLHFAGDGTSMEQWGYMSGAYLEGIRAAQDIALCITDPMNAMCQLCSDDEYDDSRRSKSESDSKSTSDDSSDRSSASNRGKKSQANSNARGFDGEEYRKDESMDTDTKIVRLTVVGVTCFCIVLVVIGGWCLCGKKGKRHRLGTKRVPLGSSDDEDTEEEEIHVAAETECVIKVHDTRVNIAQ
eukprot:315251_1